MLGVPHGPKMWVQSQARWQDIKYWNLLTLECMYVLSAVNARQPKKHPLSFSGFKTSLRLKINCRNSLKAVCRLVAANAEMGPKLHKIVWYVFMSFSFEKLLSTETIVTGWVRSLDSGLLYPPYRCELASLMVWRCLWGRTELPPLPPASGPELQHLLWSSSQVLWVQKSIKLEECFHMGKLWVT